MIRLHHCRKGNKMNDELKIQLKYEFDKSKIKSELNQIQSEVRKSSISIDIKSNSQSLVQVQNAVKSTRTQIEILNNLKVDKLSSRFEAFYKKLNANALKKHSTEIESIKNSIQNLEFSTSDDDFAEKFKLAANKLQTFETQMKSIGSTQDTVFTKLKNSASKFAESFNFSTIITKSYKAAKYLVTSLIEIDSSMTNLKSICNENEKAYNLFFINAKKNAHDLGVSVKDVIDATAEFARMGYTLSDSAELSRVALLYKNVGDGITEQEASQSIISTMKAFNLTAEEAESIVDKFNAVGNNFAISSGGIGEALQKTVSALASAGNDLNESIALTVGANSVIQDPDAVSNMWETVSMRIRGAKTELEAAGLETEGIVTSTSQLRDTIRNITGFDILTDANTLKSTKDIIVGIGETWQNLTKTQQNSLLDTLAGNSQSNALSMTLSNVDGIKAAYDEAKNSAGSAQAEQDKLGESIGSTVDQIQYRIQELATDLIDSDLVKQISEDILGFIESLKDSRILEFITNIIDAVADIIDFVSTLTGGLKTFDSAALKIIATLTTLKKLSQASRGKMFPLTKYARQFSDGNVKRVCTVIVVQTRENLVKPLKLVA